jgi:hypothetical protein
MPNVHLLIDPSNGLFDRSIRSSGLLRELVLVFEVIIVITQ